MGVQSSNEGILRRTRGHSRDTLLHAMDLLACSNIFYNIDLIQDLDGQDDAMIEEDIRFVEQYRPPQVTWYIMRLQGEAAWWRMLKNQKLSLPTDLQSARRRLMINREMKRLGYHRQPGGRFLRDEQETDPYKRIRSGLDEVLLGLGASAYSHGWGWFFRNVKSEGRTNGIEEYANRVLNYKSPIAESRRLNASDMKVSSLIRGIRSQLPLSEIQLIDHPLSGVGVSATGLAAAGFSAGGGGAGSALAARGRGVPDARLRARLAAGFGVGAAGPVAPPSASVIAFSLLEIL